MKKISVIIPVYNVEAYLNRCIDSVLAQTHKNLQIIIVDDGSPDKCPQICDEYALKDDRITVVHKDNGGLASARNAGLAKVEGDYVFFLDSDDWLEANGLELLVRKIEEYDVDFVKYRAIRTGWPGLPENAACMVEKVRELTEGYYSRERIVKEIYPRLIATSQLTMGAVVGAWGALYKTKFLSENNLVFYEEVKFSEDLVFSANVVRKAKAFYFIDQPCVYHYFFNPSSISKSFRAGRWDSCKSLITFCTRDFQADEEYDFSTELYYLRWFCIMLSVNERKYLKNYFKRVQYCSRILKDPLIKKEELKMNLFDVSWKQKIVMRIIDLRWSWILALI